MTSDWLRQLQTGVDRWLDTQRDWWSAVTGGVQGQAGTAGGDLAELQRRTVDAWRESAAKVVDAQAELLLGALRERPADAEALLRRWTDAQRQMWEGWLGALRQGTPASRGAGPDISAAGPQMVDSLRQAAEQLVTSQADWARAWTSAQQGAEPASSPASTPSGSAGTREKRAQAKRSTAKSSTAKSSTAKSSTAKSSTAKSSTAKSGGAKRSTAKSSGAKRSTAKPSRAKRKSS